MISYLIFIVDDEQALRDALTMALEGAYHVRSYASAEAALGEMQAYPPDLVLLDIGLPGMSGLEALGQIKQRSPDTVVIMITADEDLQTVITAMKSGAYDYLVKPIPVPKLEVTIEKALETIRLRKEVRALQDRHLEESLPCFIGESKAIQGVLDVLDKVAKSPDAPILILGETGTGKEWLASAIHYRSPNFQGPLVFVNCAAIPRELIESELFGYERGAFSGAAASGKRGLIEEAAEGTLCLDEVGDLYLEAQAKLLRFLESGEFYRVGGTKQRRVQTRVVSATNKNLEKMVEEGAFRKDLYFRLGAIKMQVPSLNERPEDVLPLAKHFLLEFAKKYKKAFNGISTEVESALIGHRWTGNVRELRNLLERGVLVSSGPQLTVQDLGLGPLALPQTPRERLGAPALSPLGEAGVDLEGIMKVVEWSYFRRALELAGGNESGAARLLGLNHHTFRYRLKKHQS